MNYLNKVLVLAVVLSSFSCKSGKESTETAKKEVQEQPKEETRTNSSNEIKTTNERVPTQTLSGGQQNTNTTPNGQKPR